jgi:hypothetical protein
MKHARPFVFSWIAAALAFGLAARKLWPDGVEQTTNAGWGLVVWAAIAYSVTAQFVYPRVMRWARRFEVNNSDNSLTYMIVGALSYFIPMWIFFPPVGYGLGAPLLTWPAVQPFGIAYIVGGATYGFAWTDNKGISPSQ